jgi:uncharacterized GH25 family protein
VLVKKGTAEQVAGPQTTDDKGHVAFMVPEAGDYELKVVEDSGRIGLPAQCNVEML